VRTSPTRPELRSWLTNIDYRYIFDYAIIIILAVGFFILDAVEPYHQEFSLRNYTLRYKYAVHERVPVPWLLVICAIAPMIIIAVYTIVIDGMFSTSKAGRKQYSFKSRLWELNCGILGLFLAIGASFVITGRRRMQKSWCTWYWQE
jgi:diacylglycerol diphosphate phosphatase/phosphatidate phosphatase